MEVLDENELVFQAKLLCRDFMYSRIIREGLSWGNVEPHLPDAPEGFREASRVLLKLGDELESVRPRVYRNVARQLSVCVEADAAVSGAFLFVAMEILSLGITWAKVAAVFAVAAGLAVDCVRLGRPGAVRTLEESVGELARRILVPWLRRRGGWRDVRDCVRNAEGPAPPRRLSAALTTWKRLVKTTYTNLMECVRCSPSAGV